jgi:hypothetical protein
MTLPLYTLKYKMLLKCQTVYTWKTCILWYDFKAYVRHLYVNIKPDKNRVFFKSFEVKVINALVVISHKLQNNFKGLVTSGLGPDGWRWPSLLR